MWEVWEWDGRYIKGNLLKRYKSKQSAIKYAKEEMGIAKITSCKEDLHLDNEEDVPVGIIVKGGE